LITTKIKLGKEERRGAGGLREGKVKLKLK